MFPEHMKLIFVVIYEAEFFLMESAYFLFLRFYLFIFRKRGREGVREGEKHQYVVASLVPTTGDLASNPGMCPDWESNW